MSYAGDSRASTTSDDDRIPLGSPFLEGAADSHKWKPAPYAAAPLAAAPSVVLPKAMGQAMSPGTSPSHQQTARGALASTEIFDERLMSIQKRLCTLDDIASPMQEATAPQIPRNRVTTSVVSPSQASGALRKFSGDANAPRFSDPRQECRARQVALADATQHVSVQLGAGHPYVEEAKREIQRLRNYEEGLRQREVVQWHEANVANALQVVEDGNDIQRLEAAVTLVHDSELGPGHRLVTDGKAHILRLRKLRTVDALRQLQAHHIEALETAAQADNLGALATAINDGAKALGPAHPAVEAHFRLYKERRGEVRRSEWDTILQIHGEMMMNACSSNDPTQIEDRIAKTLEAGLGQDHIIIEQGKAYLLQLRKGMQHEEAEQSRMECQQMLSDLTLGARQAVEQLEEKINMQESLWPQLDPCVSARSYIPN